METSSPHDAAARRRFEAEMNARLWYEMKAEWDEEQGFLLRSDLDYAAWKRRNLNPPFII